MKERHAGIIRIDYKLLTKILDFEEATIHRIYTPEGYLSPGYFCVVMEHPDLPPVKENECLSEITPTMQVWYGENGCLLKIERISPEKKADQI